jgi:hypothetical protein
MFSFVFLLFLVLALVNCTNAVNDNLDTSFIYSINGNIHALNKSEPLVAFLELDYIIFNTCDTNTQKQIICNNGDSLDQEKWFAPVLSCADLTADCYNIKCYANFPQIPSSHYSFNCDSSSFKFNNFRGENAMIKQNNPNDLSSFDLTTLMFNYNLNTGYDYLLAYVLLWMFTVLTPVLFTSALNTDLQIRVHGNVILRIVKNSFAFFLALFTLSLQLYFLIYAYALAQAVPILCVFTVFPGLVIFIIETWAILTFSYYILYCGWRKEQQEELIDSV